MKEKDPSSRIYQRKRDASQQQERPLFVRNPETLKAPIRTSRRSAIKRCSRTLFEESTVKKQRRIASSKDHQGTDNDSNSSQQKEANQNHQRMTPPSIQSSNDESSKANTENSLIEYEPMPHSEEISNSSKGHASQDLEQSLQDPDSPPSLFSLAFMFDQWMVRKEDEPIDEDMINLIGIDSMKQLKKFLFGIESGTSPEEVFSFLKLSVECRVSFKIVALIVLFYLKECNIQHSILLFNLVKQDRSLPYSSIIHYVIAQRLSSVQDLYQNSYAENIPNEIHDTLVGRDPNLDFYLRCKPKVLCGKIFQLIMHNTVDDCLHNYANFFTNSFSTSMRDKFMKDLTMDSLKYFNNSSYTLKDLILLTNQKLGNGTSPFLTAVVAGKPKNLEMHQKVIASNFVNGLSPTPNATVACTESDVQLFVSMIYGYPRIRSDLEAITPAFFDLVATAGIQDSIDFVFEKDFSVLSYDGRNKIQLIHAILKYGNSTTTQLFDEIIKNFKKVVPSVKKNKFLKMLNEYDMIKLVSQKELSIDPLEKYYLCVKWAYVQCNEVWDEGDYPIFNVRVKNMFQKIVRSLDKQELFSVKHLILQDRFISPEEFDS